jgi:hypothetical protein
MKLKPITAIAVLVLVVAFLSVAGCTTQQQTTQSGNATPATTADMSVAAKVVQTPQQIGGETPRPGYKFVAYNCTVKNINAQNRPIAPNYWSLMDTGGRVYNISGLTIVQSLNPFGGTSHSQPRDVISGPVFFEVPQNATLKSLTYNDGSTNIVTTI